MPSVLRTLLGGVQFGFFTGADFSDLRRLGDRKIEGILHLGNGIGGGAFQPAVGRPVEVPHAREIIGAGYVVGFDGVNTSG